MYTENELKYVILFVYAIIGYIFYKLHMRYGDKKDQHEFKWYGIFWPLIGSTYLLFVAVAICYFLLLFSGKYVALALADNEKEREQIKENFPF